MEFFRIKKDIPFMSWGRVTTAISLATFVLAIFFLATRGLNLAVDFTGGTVMEVHYPHTAPVESIRRELGTMGLQEAYVQNFGSSQDVLIRLPLSPNLSTAQLSEKVLDSLKHENPDLQLRRVEFVGPQVGKELLEDGSAALLFVIIGIVAYLSIRFRWRPAVATIIANLHDVVIILGFFSFFRWDF